MFALVAAQCARKHLGKLGMSPRRHNLAKDLLLLVCRVRPSLLWDYWAIEEAADRQSLTPTQVDSFLSDLRTSWPQAVDLRLVKVGPSLFIVHASELRSWIVGSVDFRLIAVDVGLGTPRACSQAEDSIIRECLAKLGEELLDLMAAYEVGIVRLECAQMVAAHGWLLGYPVVYCFVSSLASAATCLSGEPLAVCRVKAIVSEAAGSRESTSHLVCSFSFPACEAPLQQAWLVDWWAALKEKFASPEARACWQDPFVEVDIVRQDVVV